MSPVTSTRPGRSFRVGCLGFGKLPVRIVEGQVTLERPDIDQVARACILILYDVAITVGQGARLGTLILDRHRRDIVKDLGVCLLYTSPSPRDLSTSRMPSSA